MNDVRKIRLVVLISGSGSNLQALIDASERGTLPADIVGVVSNRADAFGLTRAHKHAIPTLFFPKQGTRRDYDAALAEHVATFRPDFVVLAGWLRLLSMAFLERFPNRVVNLHPALPGELPGLHAIERALDEARRGERTYTGVMVHLVPDEGVDSGPVLAQERVEILADDTLETLRERMRGLEHHLLITTLRRLATGGLDPDAPPHFE